MGRKKRNGSAVVICRFLSLVRALGGHSAPLHNGPEMKNITQNKFNHLIIHFPTSEGVSKVSEQANESERMSKASSVKQANM